jgi:hypothetical protein
MPINFAVLKIDYFLENLVHKLYLRIYHMLRLVSHDYEPMYSLLILDKMRHMCKVKCDFEICTVISYL